MAQPQEKDQILTAPEGHILLGAAGKYPICLNLKYANRHGLIAGATGTGKTVTLQIMTEAFSNAGVPVFLADVKGDLSGLCQDSKMESFLVEVLIPLVLLTTKRKLFQLSFGICLGNKATQFGQQFQKWDHFSYLGCLN